MVRRVEGKRAVVPAVAQGTGEATAEVFAPECVADINGERFFALDGEIKQRMRAKGDYETTSQTFIARQLTRRLRRSEQVAELAVYLASDLLVYATGHVRLINGGLSL